MVDQVFVPGALSASEETALRDNLKILFERFSEGGRRRTVGTLVGDIRRKLFPDNAIQGEPTRVVFVVDVRLRDFADQPIVRDALVTNQAQQLIAGSSASGTPVTLEIVSGVATVIGRAALTTESASVAYYTVLDLDGQEMEFVLGLRLKTAGDLDAALLARINAWRVGEGLTEFTVTSRYFEDPTIDFHGAEYYQAYIGPSDGGRFYSEVAGLVCALVETVYPWTSDADPGPWTSNDLVGFPGQNLWSASRQETLCE